MNQPVYKSVNTHLLSDLANSFYNLGAILLSAEVVQMRALVRLRWETLSADRHLRTVVQATRDLMSLQPSLPHSRSTPELPQLLADLGTGSPLVRCCTTSPRGSRRYAVLVSMFWSSQHFLCYFNPKWGSHSSVRQLYSHWSSKEELRKFQPLSESQISDSFDVLKGILTHTRNDFSGEMNALVE